VGALSYGTIVRSWASTVGSNQRTRGVGGSHGIQHHTSSLPAVFCPSVLWRLDGPVARGVSGAFDRVKRDRWGSSRRASFVGCDNSFCDLSVNPLSFIAYAGKLFAYGRLFSVAGSNPEPCYLVAGRSVSGPAIRQSESYLNHLSLRATSMRDREAGRAWSGDWHGSLRRSSSLGACAADARL
jgi:hypothetical protein